jgi:hypothetical protein
VAPQTTCVHYGAAYPPCDNQCGWSQLNRWNVASVASKLGYDTQSVPGLYRIRFLSGLMFVICFSGAYVKHSLAPLFSLRLFGYLAREVGARRRRDSWSPGLLSPIYVRSGPP